MGSLVLNDLNTLRLLVTGLIVEREWFLLQRQLPVISNGHWNARTWSWTCERSWNPSCWKESIVGFASLENRNLCVGCFDPFEKKWSSKIKWKAFYRDTKGLSKTTVTE